MIEQRRALVDHQDLASCAVRGIYQLELVPALCVRQTLEHRSYFLYSKGRDAGPEVLGPKETHRRAEQDREGGEAGSISAIPPCRTHADPLLLQGMSFNGEPLSLSLCVALLRFRESFAQ